DTRRRGRGRGAAPAWSGERLDDLKAVEIRHLHVEEQKVRTERDDPLDRVPSTSASGDDRRPAALLEHWNETTACNGLIVGHDCGDRRHPAPTNETPLARNSAVAASSRRRRSGVAPSSSVDSSAARR